MTEGGSFETGGAGKARKSLRLGLIGKGIAQSRSPKMHMEEAAAQGLDLSYELIDPSQMDGGEPEIAGLLDRAEAEGFAGVNITHPYKRAAVAHLDTLSDAAREIGAVNTVVFRDGGRHGHNTDYWGFAESARRGLTDAAMDTVLLLGAGGAGSAVAHALKSLDTAHLLIHDTDEDAARALADAAGGAVVTNLSQAAFGAQGIVNATPMGMAHLPGMAIPAELIDPRHWVADIVYFPLETELLHLAREKGCRTLDGAGMAVFQAVRAFGLFTGLTADPARMRATFESFGAAG